MVIELTTDERDLDKVLKFLKEMGFEEVDIRICGDRKTLVASSLKKGSYGYIFLRFVEDETRGLDLDQIDQKLGYFGKVLKSEYQSYYSSEAEALDNSISLFDLRAADLEDQVVIINSGDFRRLKGVVKKEHNGASGREVDVEIKTMTLTRIITIPKRMVTPILLT